MAGPSAQPVASSDVAGGRLSSGTWPCRPLGHKPRPCARSVPIRAGNRRLTCRRPDASRGAATRSTILHSRRVIGRAVNHHKKHQPATEPCRVPLPQKHRRVALSTKAAGPFRVRDRNPPETRRLRGTALVRLIAGSGGACFIDGYKHPRRRQTQGALPGHPRRTDRPQARAHFHKDSCRTAGVATCAYRAFGGKVVVM